jgi:small subunit ribosomal protein S17
MKILIGKVVSTKMDKTATVAVERVVVHPLYKKRFKRVKKYHVHDELGVKVNDVVKFVASKPYSKSKKWKLVEIVEDETKKKKKTVKEGKDK